MKRPKAVVTAAVIAFAFGVMGLGSAIFTLPIFNFDPGAPIPPQEQLAYQAYIDHPGLLTYARVMIVVAIIVAIALIVIGFGLLKLAPWARRAMIAWAVYLAVSGIVGVVVMIKVYMPSIDQAVSKGADPLLAKTTKIALWGGVASSFLTSLIVPAIVLGLLLRPGSKEAFRTGGVSDPNTDPVRHV